MDTSARRRLGDGTVATDQASGRLEARAADLLTAALRVEETARSEQPSAAAVTRTPAPSQLDTASVVQQAALASSSASATTAAAHSASEGRIDRALALVERIERFVRSGRPSLALTLRGGVPGELEVQRVGRGAISLRLSSPRPPSSSELGELRQALEARGLSVRSFEARRLGAETGRAAREDRDAIVAEADKPVSALKAS